MSARPVAAIDALTNGQEQADMNGERVKVSRQAVDEVLTFARTAYAPTSLETAACAWEAVLDMEGFTVSEDYDPAGNDRYQAQQDRAVAIKAARETSGTSALRMAVIGWVDAIDAAWKAVDTDEGREPQGGQFMESFDWDFVPDWIVQNVDWTGPNAPTIKARAPEPNPAASPTIADALSYGLAAPRQCAHGEPLGKWGDCPDCVREHNEATR